MKRDPQRNAKGLTTRIFIDDDFSDGATFRPTLRDEPSACGSSGLAPQRRREDDCAAAPVGGPRLSLNVFSAPELKTRFAPLSLTPSASGARPASGARSERPPAGDASIPARRDLTLRAGQQIALPAAASRLGSWVSRAGSFSLHASLLYLIASSSAGDYGSSDIQSTAISFNIETSQVMDSIEPQSEDKGAAADAPLVESAPEPEPKPKPEEKLPEPPKPDDMPVLAAKDVDAPIAVPEPIKPPEEQKEEPKPPEEVKKVEEKKDENETRREPPRPRLANIATSSGMTQTAHAGGKVSASFGDIRNYNASIRARIAQHKPRGVERRGVTVVSFEISSNGQLANCRVAESSGNATLDSAAVRAIQAASPFPAPPGGQSLSYTIPFKFH